MTTEAELFDRARNYWDQRYEESAESAEREPADFMVQAFARFIQPAYPAAGDALDVAGGAGRNALYLAGHGWRVTLADISKQGIALALGAAQKRGVALNTMLGDTRQLDFGQGGFDLAMGFNYLDRQVFAKMAAALRPGGFAVYQTFTREHAKFVRMGAERGPYFLAAMELQNAFPGFAVLFYDENSKERGLARIVARKPAS